jgi:uncharacterized damage-inducible protein DinB
MIPRMSIVGPLLGELQFESASTIKMLERVPREHFDWRPHEKSMSLGTLAWHLATIPKTISNLLAAGEFDLTKARPAGAPAGDIDLVGEYKRNLENIRAQIGAMDDDAVKAPFTLRRGDQILQTLPKMAVLRNIFMNHSIHHRAQMTVYLRILDVPLPAIYGTSADEMAQ